MSSLNPGSIRIAINSYNLESDGLRKSYVMTPNFRACAKLWSIRGVTGVVEPVKEATETIFSVVEPVEAVETSMPHIPYTSACETMNTINIHEAKSISFTAIYWTHARLRCTNSSIERAVSLWLAVKKRLKLCTSVITEHIDRIEMASGLIYLVIRGNKAKSESQPNLLIRTYGHTN